MIHGHLSISLSNSLFNDTLLILFTISGYVRLSAIFIGTPNSSNSILGSGVITLRAEKSTRFPIRLFLIRPSLPFNLCLIDFKGRPDLCVLGLTPLDNSLSINVAI